MISPIPTVTGILDRNGRGLWCVTTDAGKEYLLSPGLVVTEKSAKTLVRAVLQGKPAIAKVVAFFAADAMSKNED